MTTISFREGGGISTVELPAVDATLGFWVKPCPIPGTPAWEWVVTNIPTCPLPGMVAGYADTEDGARHALRGALAFWRARGYSVTQEAP